jgi:hypothetical protein
MTEYSYNIKLDPTNAVTFKNNLDNIIKKIARDEGFEEELTNSEFFIKSSDHAYDDGTTITVVITWLQDKTLERGVREILMPGCSELLPGIFTETQRRNMENIWKYILCIIRDKYGNESLEDK